MTGMDIHVGDRLVMKKQHPCGSNEWDVLRIGADFRLRCCGCGHEVMGSRQKFEKRIRKVLRNGEPVDVSRRPPAKQTCSDS